MACDDPTPGDKLACDAIETVIVPRARDLGSFEVRRALPSDKRQMVGPFIFFDQMGPSEFLLGAGMSGRTRTSGCRPSPTCSTARSCTGVVANGPHRAGQGRLEGGAVRQRARGQRVYPAAGAGAASGSISLNRRPSGSLSLLIRRFGPVVSGTSPPLGWIGNGSFRATRTLIRTAGMGG